MNEEKVLTLRGKKAVWAPGGGGGGVLVANMQLADENWDGTSETEVFLDKSANEICTAHNQNKLVYICVYGTFIPLTKVSDETTFAFSGFGSNGNQARPCYYELHFDGSKWFLIADVVDVYDLTVVGLTLVGEDNIPYRITVNNASISATEI